MKKLIVSGDSNTDLNFRSSIHPNWDTSFKKWPEHLAEHLGMELVCLGKGGMGNEYIYHSILEEIKNTPKEEIGLVIAAWTQCHRKDWQKNSRWGSTKVDQDGDLLYWVKRSMNHRLSFQILCERYKLPHYQFQMIDLFENYIQGLKPSEEEFLANHPEIDAFGSYLERIEIAAKRLHGLDDAIKYPGNIEEDRLKIIKLISWYKGQIKNFIGWPGLIKGNYAMYRPGYYMENIENYVDDNGRLVKMEWGMVMMTNIKFLMGFRCEDVVMSEVDDHPNELGHKQIADFLIKERSYDYELDH